MTSTNQATSKTTTTTTSSSSPSGSVKKQCFTKGLMDRLKSRSTIVRPPGHQSKLPIFIWESPPLGSLYRITFLARLEEDGDEGLGFRFDDTVSESSRKLAWGGMVGTTESPGCFLDGNQTFLTESISKASDRCRKGWHVRIGKVSHILKAFDDVDDSLVMKVSLRKLEASTSITNLISTTQSSPQLSFNHHHTKPNLDSRRSHTRRPLPLRPSATPIISSAPVPTETVSAPTQAPSTPAQPISETIQAILTPAQPTLPPIGPIQPTPLPSPELEQPKTPILEPSIPSSTPSPPPTASATTTPVLSLLANLLYIPSSTKTLEPPSPLPDDTQTPFSEISKPEPDHIEERSPPPISPKPELERIELKDEGPVQPEIPSDDHQIKEIEPLAEPTKGLEDSQMEVKNESREVVCLLFPTHNTIKTGKGKLKKLYIKLELLKDLEGFKKIIMEGGSTVPSTYPPFKILTKTIYELFITLIKPIISKIDFKTNKILERTPMVMKLFKTINKFIIPSIKKILSEIVKLSINMVETFVFELINVIENVLKETNDEVFLIRKIWIITSLSQVKDGLKVFLRFWKSFRELIVDDDDDEEIEDLDQDDEELLGDQEIQTTIIVNDSNFTTYRALADYLQYRTIRVAPLKSTFKTQLTIARFIKASDFPNNYNSFMKSRSIIIGEGLTEPVKDFTVCDPLSLFKVAERLKIDGLKDLIHKYLTSCLEARPSFS
ncbi:hypothetical protein CROQUDRAFT_666404 [Cronartium quercuum f. sp. fusiforme G11]|uniref:Uncharacterized protein n=1 Tax=Cronartium quercuum f. sp. fusiforme G11 TaxID=708437 RepID=A0A9P6N660_9BASI|nr:hypothetical protein CROQUDRAFT_666404 [Cronartium quercuum f. sp. fusiforme G11]